MPNLVNRDERNVQDKVDEGVDNMVVGCIVTFVVGLLGGFIAKKLGMPAPFMTGSMLAVALFSIVFAQAMMPSTLKTIAQVISGAYIGQQISKQDIFYLPKIGKPILFLMALFTVNMFLMGWIFHVFFDMDLITAWLSCMPGGIMDVSLISIDMGAKSEIVATMQLIRLVGMLLILPYWIMLIMRRFGHGQMKSGQRQQKKTAVKKNWNEPINTVKNDTLILFIATLGGGLGVVSGIPVGALIFSLFFSGALKIAKNTSQINGKVHYTAQILAGSIIGSSFSRSSLAQLHSLIIPAIILLCSYLVINVLFAVVIYKRGVFDLQSALFASSPAGATDISLIAGELGGDMSKIVAIQISRTVYTIVILPTIIRFFL